MQDAKLVALVKELFEVLDSEEETEDGRRFRPTTINSRRTAHVIKLNRVLKEMKEYTK
jgi:hypothetical protein